MIATSAETPQKRALGKLIMSTINEKTTVPLPLLVATVGGAVGLTFWLAAMRSDIDALRRDVASLTTAVLQAEKPTPMMDRWTHTDMRAWVEDVRRKNPAITIPPAERAAR